MAFNVAYLNGPPNPVIRPFENWARKSVWKVFCLGFGCSILRQQLFSSHLNPGQVSIFKLRSMLWMVVCVTIWNSELLVNPFFGLFVNCITPF